MDTVRITRRILLVLLAMVAVALVASAQTTPPWSWGPILGAISEDTAAITWKTSRSVGFDFSYALAQVYDASGQWEETLTYDNYEGVAEIWLRDLLPGSVYRYQLIFYEGDAVYPTEVGSFHTMETNARGFSFAVYGATSSNPDRHKLVADQIAASEDPAFVVHTGQLTEFPSAERYANLFWAISDLARASPFLSVIGGNDGEDSIYFDSFALPKGGGINDEQWWSFDYGSVHFVALDSTIANTSNLDAFQEQTAWLRQDLLNAQDKLIVVFCHDPLYSASMDAASGAWLREHWEPIFNSYGVDVVLSSAVHCYEHIYRLGTHYIISGGGGAPLAPEPNARATGTVFARYGLLHYVRGTVADDALRMEVIPVASIVDDQLYLSATGNSIDTFVLSLPN